MNVPNWCRGPGRRLSHCAGGRITWGVVDRQTATIRRRVGPRSGEFGLFHGLDISSNM